MPQTPPRVPWGPVHPDESPDLEELMTREQATGLCRFSSRNVRGASAKGWSGDSYSPAAWLWAGQSTPPTPPGAVRSVPPRGACYLEPWMGEGTKEESRKKGMAAQGSPADTHRSHKLHPFSRSVSPLKKFHLQPPNDLQKLKQEV